MIEYTVAEDIPPFRNEPPTDFSKPENRAAMEAALRKVESELGRQYRCYIDGEWVSGPRSFDSLVPWKSSLVVGSCPEADDALTEKAVQASVRAFGSWRHSTADDRWSIFTRLAQLLRDRKLEICAWMAYESGKPWAEADGDVAEAIDFVEFYVRGMMKLSREIELIDPPGERNRMVYVPVGPGAVIPPWNFPCAILCGTTIAPVMMGNTVVVKPSENAPVVAMKFVELLVEAGLPGGVVNLVTGGPSVGRYLVRHPSLHFVSFTGSMKAGCEINEVAAKVQSGQGWLKRVVAEMGGKNALVVAEDADLDEAVEGTVQSAFGYQGQKCSAGSRAIVVDSLYEAFVEKLRESASRLKVGPAIAPDTDVSAVISAAAHQRVRDYVEIGKREGKLVLGEEPVPGDGYYVAPTILRDIEPQHRVAQEEIFGPVIAVIRAKDFDDALTIANGTQFALTGAVFSKDPAKLERAAREYDVGNLYFNRKCTGSIVAQQPFGGFKMSGTDAKAGGPDYLLNFCMGKSITTRTS